MSHSLVRTRLACYNLIMILVQNLKYLFGAQDTQRCCPDLDNNLTARICNALATFFPKDNISYVPLENKPTLTWPLLERIDLEDTEEVSPMDMETPMDI